MRQHNHHSGLLGVLALGALLPAFVGGCSRSYSATGELSVPQPNTVRLIPGKADAVTPDRLHWTWSVLGERNWTKPVIEGKQISLSDAYPLNDVQRTHGTNTWNCELLAERRASDPTAAHWTLRLHGSNGMTAQATGVEPLKGGDLSSLFVPVQTDPALQNLPSQITIARINGSDVQVNLSK